MNTANIIIKTALALSVMTAGAVTSVYADTDGDVRRVILLDEGWKFGKGENPAQWEDVTIPHDWAIYGPFDRENDIQTIAVVQNGEETASVKTGRTGGLPYVGVGWYVRNLDVDMEQSASSYYCKRRATLVFDGAMSEARVYVNGHEVIFWPYGYNSFYCDITPYLTEDGKNNELKVRLENKPQSSRWYPGAGLYRNVWLIETNDAHIPVWGTTVTTELNGSGDTATVRLAAEVECIPEGFDMQLTTTIYDRNDKVVASSGGYTLISDDGDGLVKAEQTFRITDPELWSPETPSLYRAETGVTIYPTPPDFKPGEQRYVQARKELCDTYTTTFGIRTIEVRPETGFYLNGQNRKFKGVCLHHDLGPLGAAVNRSALRHQLSMLKDMGCDAIRTTHNMPAPELIELCDEMGFMVVYRNNPSVVMWSIGNEVPSQWSEEGVKVARFLQDICHREDPTRPVTCGMDQIDAVLSNGFAAVLDVPGFNYRTFKYLEGYNTLPQKMLLGSETSSTVSSRGIYHFPVEKKAGALYEDHQSSSYDMEYCGWSNIPDEDLALAEDYPWTMGQFVWTGFDYLGEPTPYDTDAWPNHSSMFGIIDLASIPKDRYWLYRSVWNEDSPTLHVLPHWNWEGREGVVTPVFVYTSWPKAELLVNGKSMGFREKGEGDLLSRYRLIWDDVRYEPGEITVIAYDENNFETERKTIRTAGKPYRIELVPSRDSLIADGKDLLYVTVRIVDRDGNLCPLDTRKVRFEVSGAGQFRAVANGDPTCLESFQSPEMSAFSGMLTVIVQSDRTPGPITLTAKAKGLKKAVLETISR